MNRLCQFVFIQLGIFLLSVFPNPSHALRSVENWEIIFQQLWQIEYEKYGPDSLSGDSWKLYSLGHAIDANVAMYQATDKLKYLDRALYYVNNCISTSIKSSLLKSSQFQDSYYTWVNKSNPGKGNDGKEYSLYESYCWRYVARMLRVMRDEGLAKDQRYMSQYQSILNFTENNVFMKWYSRGAFKHIYRSRIHMAAHWAYITLELFQISENEYLRKIYKEIFTNINYHMPNYRSSIKKQIIRSPIDNDAYFWNQRWGSYARPGQDVAHANNVVSYIVESYSLGYVWTDEDVELFCNLFIAIIWPQPKVYSWYLDGSGKGNGWFGDGFSKLGRFNRIIQLRLESHTDKVNTQFVGNCALNAKILNTQCQ